MARRKRKSGSTFRFNFSGIFDLTPELRHSMSVIFVLLIAVLMILGLFDAAGLLGGWLIKVLKIMFGRGFGIFPFVLLLVGVIMIDAERFNVRPINYFGLVILILTYSGLFHIKIDPELSLVAVKAGVGGGYVGWFITMPLLKVLGYWGTWVILVGLLLVSIFFTFNLSFQSLLRRFDELKYLKEKLSTWWYQIRHRDSSGLSREDENEDEDEAEEDDEEEEVDESVVAKPQFTGKGLSPVTGNQQELSITKPRRQVKIELPIHLLNPSNSKPTSGDIQGNREKIHKAFENFGIEVEMGEVSVGPTVTQYTLKPSEGVKLASITALHNDLALALAAHPIRIEAPIPGKSLVGIEVPNHSIATVSLREIIDSKEFREGKSLLTLGVGKDVAGKVWTASLDKMPHLLIAGATGSGKSVCINTILLSLLYQNNPADLKFILVDPKRVELNHYNDLPYLLTPVITDVQKTVNALKWVVGEMDQRYTKLSQVGSRNLDSYNTAHPQNRMPYIVVVIDELADLMSVAAQEVEGAIIRLAQMARAVGIHLVLATQRPSVDVITGLIKANITSRIAFAVASQTDSRTILDTAGAEKLLGRGDMLFTSAEISKPKRLQGAFVSDEEVNRITEYIKKQVGNTDYDKSITEHKKIGLGGGGYGSDEDDLLPEARDLVIKAGKASASYLQRRLRVGYARAARLLDLLEEEGVIGPAEGAKPRDVLITAEEFIRNETIQAEQAYEQDELDDYEEVEESDENDIEDSIDEAEEDDSGAEEVEASEEDEAEENTIEDEANDEDTTEDHSWRRR